MKPFFGLLGKVFAWIIFSLPFRVRNWLGDAIGILWFDILRIRRDVVTNNIAIAFPQMERADRVKLGRRGMRNFGRGLLEYTLLPFIDKIPVERQFVFGGLEHIENARAKGKGMLLLTLHLGNGDLATAGLSKIGLPIHLVSKEFKLKWLNELWFGMRARVGTKFIPARNSSYSILKTLKRNGIAVFVNDQFTGPPIGIKAKFFGVDAGTGLGLALIAERSGAAVVPGYTIRNENGMTEVHFEEEIPYEASEDRDQGLAHMTQIYNDRLEKYVRMYPDQWMWLHKRWKLFKY